MTEPAQPMDVERSGADLGARVANSALMLWSLNMAMRGLQLVTLAILARALMPADFGVVAIATTIMIILEAMTNVEVGNALVRTRGLDDSHLSTAFTLNFLRGLAMAALLAAVASPLARFMNAPGLDAILYALTITTILNGLHNPYFMLYSRNLDFKKDSQRRAFATLAGSIISIGLAFLLRSYWALVAGNIAQALVNLLLSYWRVPGRPRLSLTHYREMLGFGVWLLVQNLFLQLALRIEIFFIGKVMDTKTVGAYTVGNQINSMATGDVIPTLTRAMFPAFAIMNNDPDRLRRNYAQVQAAGLAIALPIGFTMALLAKPMIYLLFGPGWELAIPVVQFMAPVFALQTVGAGVEALAMALGRVRMLAARSVIYMVLRTVAMYLGYHYGGLIGLLMARAASGIFQSLYGLSLAAVLTSRRIYEPFKASWRSFASVGVMSAVVLMLPDRAYGELPEWMLATELGWRGLLCIGLYLSTHGLLWIASGRPEGSETKVTAQIHRLALNLLTMSRRAPR
ncbi:lipopolysaccharide biosynthesis protein [Sphingobium estronivorans]|uniref:lipopolysaccharide biosynthesis protein n=1 Tax=Sphingobium estronivorans TaxID=1577690 RepID=UPI001239F4E1|nr:lipopolysaccharide biosynthesis protein [Sphingobium estronivorans]